MKKIFSLLAISSLLFLGCDKVEFPNQQFTIVVPTSDTIRKIFIEDFTGHTCPNCPSAARMIDSLKTLYPGRIVSMAVHNDFFAEPCPPHGLPNGATPGTFTEDFRVTAEDADYNTTFQSNNFNLPAGLVNRYAIFPSYVPQLVADWPILVSNMLDTAMSAYIKITPSYNSTSRVLNATVTGEFMKDTTGTYHIALYLTESGIVASQVDGLTINNSYTFNDIFRGCINSPGTIGGEQIAAGTILNGQQINYTMTNPFTVSASFNDSNCKIVAILFKDSDKGVLQAAECNLR